MVDVVQVNNLRNCTYNQLGGNTTYAGAVTAGSNTYYNYWDYVANTSSWDSVIPAAPTGGTVLCVGCMRCGTDTYLRCGASCTWTVPAGVTVALFELWGPGAGTMPGCCCSIQPFGATGEYYAICRPVQAGTVYQLNAGCAYCCYNCQGIAPGLCGSCTYVCQCGASPSTGCGCFFGGIISARSGFANFPYSRIKNAFWGINGGYCTTFDVNFFATPQVCSSNATATVYYSYFHCASGLTSLYNTSAGQCTIAMCSCGESCFGTATCTYGVVPSVPLNRVNCCFWTCTLCDFCLNCTGVRYQGILIPSRSSEFCFTNGSLCGYVKHPAIPGYANVSQCCVSWSSTQATFGGYLCSPLQGSNYLYAPGSGGNMVYTVAGCNSNCGDSGRGGMVRVTYC